MAEAAAKARAAADPRARLKQIIAARCMKKGAFKLASGATSNFYFDMKPALLDPEGSHLVAKLMLDVLKNEAVDAVGGLAMGAVPIASSICTLSELYGDKRIPAFFVRKEPKERGTEQLVEGNVKAGATAVVVEDVTTKGGSAMKAVAAVRAMGCTVNTVLTVLDRQEGAEANLAKEGIRLVALFRREEFE
jgi:orotate phosphoribosyltransferase